MKIKIKFKMLATIVFLLGVMAVFFACNNDKDDDEIVLIPPEQTWGASCEFNSDPYDVDNVKLTYRIRNFDSADAKLALKQTEILVASHRLYNDNDIDYFINGWKLIKAFESAEFEYENNMWFHDVEIVVPKESFVFNYGAISINNIGEMTEKISGAEINDEGQFYEVEREITHNIGGNVVLYYKIDGNKVCFSNKQYKKPKKLQFTEFINCPLSVGYADQTNKNEAVDFCAINSDKSVFAPDDVTVKLSIGRLFDEAEEENSSVYLSLFSDSLIYGDKIYTTNVNATEESEGLAYEIKNYTSKNYSCERILDGDGNTVDIRYNHEESFTLPSELFLSKYGENLKVKIYDDNPRINAEAKLLAQIVLYYYKFDGKVYLMPKYS